MFFPHNCKILLGHGYLTPCRSRRARHTSCLWEDKHDCSIYQMFSRNQIGHSYNCKGRRKTWNRWSRSRTDNPFWKKKKKWPRYYLRPIHQLSQIFRIKTGASSKQMQCWSILILLLFFSLSKKVHWNTYASKSVSLNWHSNSSVFAVCARKRNESGKPSLKELWRIGNKAG